MKSRAHMFFRYEFSSACLGVASALILLGACTTSPGRFSDTPDTLDETAFAGLIGALSPQDLRTGQCGLFLWSRDDTRDLVLFGSGSRAEAKMNIAGQDVTFARTAAEGANTLGQYPRQSYQRGDLSINLSMDIEPRPNLSGGAVVPRGSLRFEQTGGWNLVLPVGGIIACQPE